MTSLKKLITARWFPTVTKPILSGLFASGVVVALRAFGVTDVVPAEVNAAVAPVVGFLLAAIVQKTGKDMPVGTVQVQATVATHTAAYKPGKTLGGTIAEAFVSDIAREIDNDPTLLKGLAAKALERVLNPATPVSIPHEIADALAVAAPAIQEVIATGNEAPQKN